MDYTYGVFIYENAASFDFIGPADVFVASNYLLNKGRVLTISETAHTIKCIGGLEIVPGATIKTAPPLDILIVPGAGDMDSILALSAQTIDWIRTQADQTRFTASVCSGALILQRAGLLTNRKATTHWMQIEDLVQDSTIQVMPEMRYIRDGNIVTSQGVSAGIDMGLWLVGQLHSPDHAREVRRFIQYDPAPPYTADV